MSQFCSLCGAWRGCYGLEPTIELYVQHTVEIFRELRRVLRKDGVCFLNLGDSYATQSGTYGGAEKYKGLQANKGTSSTHKQQKPKNIGLKHKDLCGVPWRVALALQADGWWLRSDIIWAKLNPMPESVTDRPTRSHEYIFLLTKQSKYFWDQEAVREKLCESTIQRDKTPRGRKQNCGGSEISLRGIPYTQELGNMQSNPSGRNIRSVLTIATQPYPEAHFATFPTALVEKCLAAGTSEKVVCPKCGAPWARVVAKGLTAHDGKTSSSYPKGATANRLALLRQAARERGREYQNETQTLGWQPSCQCPEHHPIPTTVLDPFGGSGTVGLVAAKMGRNAILIELKPEY